MRCRPAAHAAACALALAPFAARAQLLSPPQFIGATQTFTLSGCEVTSGGRPPVLCATGTVTVGEVAGGFYQNLIDLSLTRQGGFVRPFAPTGVNIAYTYFSVIRNAPATVTSERSYSTFTPFDQTHFVDAPFLITGLLEARPSSFDYTRGFVFFESRLPGEFDSHLISIRLSTVPEPSTFAFAAAGALVLAGAASGKRRVRGA